jgi:hypothetical protein
MLVTSESTSASDPTAGAGDTVRAPAPPSFLMRTFFAIALLSSACVVWAGPTVSIHGSVHRFAMGDASDYLEDRADYRNSIREGYTVSAPHLGFSCGAELGWFVLRRLEASLRGDYMYVQGSLNNMIDPGTNLVLKGHGFALGGCVRWFFSAERIAPYGLIGGQVFLGTFYSYDGTPRGFSLLPDRFTAFAGAGAEYRATRVFAVAFEGGWRFGSVPFEEEAYGYGLPQDYEGLDFGGPFISLRLVLRPLDDPVFVKPPRFHW